VTLIQHLVDEQAAEALRAPFVLGDGQLLNDLFASAGLSSIAINTRQGMARFPSIRTMVEADLRGWLPLMGVVLSEDQIDRILKEAEVSLSTYVTSEGGAVFDMAAHIVTATKPDVEP
jgi:hypothetical protein